MCPHEYEYAGHRTYGDNIPGFAQGAYFPGDEPGTRCKLTGEGCEPDECEHNLPPMTHRTDHYCPACEEKPHHREYLRTDKHGYLYQCQVCKRVYSRDELAQNYSVEAEGMRKEIESAMADLDYVGRLAASLQYQTA